MSRNGNYIHTFTGKHFFALDPKPEDICIEDIAHALSNLCRFGGHSPYFYSVAEHSVLVSDLVPEHCALWGLLHDASEAYLCDIPRPFKEYLNNYKQIEENIQRAIATKFGLPWPIPDPVYFIDRNIVAAEANQLWGYAPDWSKNYHELKAEVEGYNPEVAEGIFLDVFDSLTKHRKVV